MSEPLNESEEALLEKVISGDLAVHSLEKSLSSTQQNNSPSPQLHHNSPFELAVRLRRGWLQHETSFDPCALPYQGLDYASIHGACAEMVVGYVPLPVGVAGPLLLNGELLQLPMATVEGTLIASTRRGCKAITESGGASAVVMQHMMSRAPVLLFPSAMRAAAFKEWMEVNLLLLSLDTTGCLHVLTCWPYHSYSFCLALSHPPITSFMTATLRGAQS